MWLQACLQLLPRPVGLHLHLACASCAARQLLLVLLVLLLRLAGLRLHLAGASCLACLLLLLLLLPPAGLRLHLACASCVACQLLLLPAVGWAPRGLAEMLQALLQGAASCASSCWQPAGWVEEALLALLRLLRAAS